LPPGECDPSPVPSPTRGGEEGGAVSSPPSLPGKGAGGLGPGAFVALLTAPGFLLLLGMNLLNGAAYWPVRNWLPTFFHDEFGLSQTRAGIYGPMTFNAAAFL